MIQDVQQTFEGKVRNVEYESERLRKCYSVRFAIDEYFSDYDVEKLMDNYSFWVNKDAYAIMKNNDSGEIISFKVAKRGNDVYKKRIAKRFLRYRDSSFLGKIVDTSGKRLSIGKLYTQCTFFTLTYKYQGEFNWKKVSKDFNHFMVKIRREYGNVACIRVWQAHESGFAHIHGILFFFDKKFKVFYHNNYYRFADRRYRVWDRHKRDYVVPDNNVSLKWQYHPFKRFWNPSKSDGTYDNQWDHSDWWGVYDLTGAIGYLCNYMLHGLEIGSRKSLLTLAKLWVYRLRSYSISRRLEILSSITKRIEGYISLEQLLLVKRLYNRNKKRRPIWEFVGVYSSMVDLSKCKIVYVEVIDKSICEVVYEVEEWV